MPNENNTLLHELLGPFMKMAQQRTALMALIHSFVSPEADNLSMFQVRSTIAKVFELMIDEDQMVGDEIDMKVTDALHSFLVSQQEIDNINNPKD